MESLCYSIEMEPRTLSQGELSTAREEAVFIVQKKEPDEASTIFTEGMRPVTSIKEMEKKVEMTDQLHRLHDLKKSAEIIRKSWDCACTSTTLEESPKIKEPLSAPF
ncbi:uncharacterized protein LOC143861526 [Tasmannia lanceolata]|uniref:uncharacterized protein LOC143861526 n=1 Tax=Tasmannia lanceolata TaxID=3420 RepID=UPI004064BB0E